MKYIEAGPTSSWPKWRRRSLRIKFGQAIARFADCVLQSGIDLRHRAIMANFGNSVDLIVQIARLRGCRSVSGIVVVQGFDNERNECRLDALPP